MGINFNYFLKNEGYYRNERGGDHQKEEKKENTVNKDIVEGNWKVLKGKIKEKWGQITDDELDAMEGKTDQISGVLQKKYGYSKEQAEKEWNAMLDSVNRDKSIRH